jgi:hypothetical protein
MSDRRTSRSFYPADFGAQSSPRRPLSQRAGSTSRSRHISLGQSAHPAGDMEIDSRMAGSQAGSRRKSITSGGASINWANDATRYGMSPDDCGTFFIPSYLRHSRYMEQLRKVCDNSLSEGQEHGSRSATGRHIPLSTSSSHVSLGKSPGTTSIHRRVFQDVVERSAPQSATDEGLRLIPSRLNSADKQAGLNITADGTEVKFGGGSKATDEAAATRANHPISKACGIYYYEVTVLSRLKDPSYIGIGFSSTKASLSRMPGWEAESWAYHGDDGFAFACTSQGKAYGPRFGREDIIGCGINFRTGESFFTKNGVHLGERSRHQYDLSSADES